MTKEEYLARQKAGTLNPEYKPTGPKLVRNTTGAILLKDDSPILKASLRSQAFMKEDFRKAIDTTFNELVGKL